MSYMFEELEKVRQLAEEGDPEAICEMGQRYLDGEDIRQDFLAAFDWFLKAAEAGSAKGQYMLGEFYSEKESLYKISTDFEDNEGISEDGDSEHDKYIFDDRYEEDPAKRIAGDPVKAFECYKKAADQGYAPAMVELGSIYSDGRKPVEKDEKKAFSWFAQAAQKGSIGGLYRLARCYRFGNGVNRDLYMARDLYKECCDKTSIWSDSLPHTELWEVNGEIQKIEEAAEAKRREEAEKRERQKKAEEAERQRQIRLAEERDVSMEVTGLFTAIIFAALMYFFKWAGAGGHDARFEGILGVIVTLVCIVGLVVTGSASLAGLTSTLFDVPGLGLIAGGIGGLLCALALRDSTTLVRNSMYYAAGCVVIFLIRIIMKRLKH